MPRVKIDYVVSFSNEDPDNQASNLLSWDVSKKRWLCSAGEPSCSVVLQLARAVKISSVQIGAHHAALVEVLVGRSETPHEPFQVLVPRSVFLSPAESRAGPGPSPGAAPAADRVRSFSGAALPAAAAQRWDRLRLVCSQPYNKHCKFGISFIHIFEPDGEPGSALAPVPAAPAPAPAAVPPRVFSMDTFSSDEEEFRPGELFAKYRQSVGDTGAQIRQATSRALNENPEAAPGTKLVKTSITKDAKQQPNPRAGPQAPSRDQPSRDQPSRDQPSRDQPSRDQRERRDNHALMYIDADERPHARIDNVVQRHKDDKRKEASTPKPKEKPRETDKVDKTPHSKMEIPLTSRNSMTKIDRDKDNRRERGDGRRRAHGNGDSSSKRKDDKRKRPHSERDPAETGGNVPEDALRPGAHSERPLDGVVFALSGYQNPRRARLRELAVALGARYRRDWGPACTHLICAFSNTPKLLEVRSSAHGASVPVACAEWIEESGRARRRLPWQWFAAEPDRRVVRPPPAPSPPLAHTSPASPRRLSECDTDDDIEEVVRQQKRARISPSPSEMQGRGGGARPEGEDSDEVEFVKDERMQGNVTVSDSDSGGETDAGPDTGGRLPPSPLSGRGALPALFAGRAFLVLEALAAPHPAPLLARYCRAYGGLLLQPSEVEEDSDCIVLCGSECDSSASAGVARGRRVRAAWVWRCHARRALLPLDEYLLHE